MGATTKIFSGYDWSLTRFKDTKTALRSERLFNQKVINEGFTSVWSVGTAEVNGLIFEQKLSDAFFQWREDSIKTAIGPSEWLIRFTSTDKFELQNRCVDKSQRMIYWDIIRSVTKKAKEQGMCSFVGTTGTTSKWDGSALVVVDGHQWKCESIKGLAVFEKVTA